MSKLGIALAGGGVRASAELGIIQALHEHDIKPDIYAGTSAGSIVASLLAYGYSPKEALKKFEEASTHIIDIAYWHIIKGIFTSSEIEGLVKGDYLESLLDIMFEGKDLQDIKPPVGFVTTEIDLGKEIIFSNIIDGVDLKHINDDKFGWISPKVNSNLKISQVVRASSSLPPIFIPKKLLGLKLVDGGVVNNIPSDVVRALGADKVITLDLGYSGAVKTKGIIDITRTSIDILMQRTNDNNRFDYGIYLDPKVYDISALETSRIQECYDRGYTYGISQIPNIIKGLEKP